MTTTPMSTSGSTGYDQSTTNQQQAQDSSQGTEQAKQVAGTAAEEAQRVAGEAKGQARNLVGELRTQVEDQSRTQRDSLVGLLRSVSDDLDEMAAQRSDGPAGDVVRQVAQRARSLSESIDGREPQDLLEDLRAVARRRPGMFLLGSLAAGVVAGRFLRGAREASSDSTTGVQATSPSGPTTSPYDEQLTSEAYLAGTPGSATLPNDPGFAAGTDPLTDPFPGEPGNGSSLGRPTGSAT
jgi:hypothetical protein